MRRLAILLAATAAIVVSLAAFALAAPAPATIQRPTYSDQIPATTCTPLVLRYFNIDKRIVDGPGGPSDPITFVAAGVHFRRGCHITSGRASLYLQFKYKDADGQYRYRTIRNAVVHANLKGDAHTLLEIVLPKNRQPDCTGTEGRYRIKLNLSPGTVVFQGKTYHMAPSTAYYPAADHGQEGKYLDCKSGASK